MDHSGGEWPLVGRTAELRALVAVAARPSPSVAVISGEAGIGKTRLLEALAVDLARRGTTVTWLRGNPSVAEVPFAAAAHLLPATAPPGRFELFQAAASTLAANGPRPVIAVDDAHTVDGSSAALVRWLHEHAGAAVALAHRNRPRPPEIDQLERTTGAVTIPLGRLDRATTGDLLTGALGSPVDGVTLERLWTATRGNPMFLRELVLSARAAGALRCRDGIWSWARWSADVSGLAHVVDRRLAALSGGERDVVELVACGEPLAIDLLEAVAADDAIAGTEAAGVLAVRDEYGAARVRLVHPLFSECVLRRLPPLRARQHRRRLAAALDARGPRDPDDVLRLADWALSAEVQLGPAPLVAAARRAIDLVELELAERLAGAAVASGGGWDAEQTLAEALRRQHRADDADEVLRAAAATATSEAQRARSAVTRAENLYWTRAQPVAADAVLAEAAPGHAEGQLAALQAMLWMMEGRVTDALGQAEGLLGAPDPELRLWVLSTAAFCANAAGHPQQALEWARDGLALAKEGNGSIWKEPQFSWARGQARLALGDLAGADADAAAGYRAAVAEHAAMRAGGFALVHGLVARQQGRRATSAGRLRDAVALLGDVDPYRLVSLALAELGLTLAQQGLLEAAGVALDDADAKRGEAMGVVAGVVELGRVWCLAWTARAADAADRALELARAAMAVGNRDAAAAAAHTAAVLGATAPAGALLGVVAEQMQGPWAELYAHEAAARGGDDPAALLDVADRYAALGANGLAAAAASAAAERLWAKGRNGAALLAADRARQLDAACDGIRPVGDALGDLTARECQVARLAADGKSSRAIAAALGISVRTVDNHLGRAYQKLGVHARDELVALVHRW